MEKMSNVKIRKRVGVVTITYDTIESSGVQALGPLTPPRGGITGKMMMMSLEKSTLF